MTEPTPPAALPDDLVDILDQQDSETLRLAADYAEQLAEHRDTVPVNEDSDDEEARDPSEKWEGTEEEWDDALDGRDDAPARATLTVKTIDDNRYYYWQWSEDGKTKSEYIGPVNPKREAIHSP